MPDVETILSFGNIPDQKITALITDAVIRRIHGHHDSTHLRMDITEYVRDARPVEVYRPRFTAGIKAEIESPPIEDRKDVMKERVIIREIDLGAGFEHDDVGRKTLVALSDHLP